MVAVLLAIGVVGNLTNTGGVATSSPIPTTPLAIATASPASIVEPTLTASEAPSATAEPTVEVTPEPTTAPTPEPKPTAIPTILKAAGRGDKVVKFTAQDAPTVARITGKGAGNFAVISYAGSEYDDLLVNEIGSYAGSVYVAAGINRLKVSSSGSWTIEIRPIDAARHWDGLSALTGKGDSVILLTGGASGITTIKNKGHSNFAVIAYSPEGDYLDLLVNEIGSYNGEVLLPDTDPMVLSVGAVGGTWSMSVVTQ